MAASASSPYSKWVKKNKTDLETRFKEWEGKIKDKNRGVEFFKKVGGWTAAAYTQDPAKLDEFYWRRFAFETLADQVEEVAADVRG